MAGVRGFVAGVVGLSLLEAFVTSKTAPAGLAGGSKLIAGGLARWLDPTVPLIPNRAGYTGTAAGGAAFTTTPTIATTETA